MGVKPYYPGTRCLLCQSADFVAFMTHKVHTFDALFHFRNHRSNTWPCTGSVIVCAQGHPRPRSASPGAQPCSQRNHPGSGKQASVIVLRKPPRDSAEIRGATGRHIDTVRSSWSSNLSHNIRLTRQPGLDRFTSRGENRFTIGDLIRVGNSRFVTSAASRCCSP